SIRSDPAFLVSAPAASVFYTLSLHDALPIFFSKNFLLIIHSLEHRFAAQEQLCQNPVRTLGRFLALLAHRSLQAGFRIKCRRGRSEEHTSELQSRFDLVCRLLLDKINATRTQ